MNTEERTKIKIYNDNAEMYANKVYERCRKMHDMPYGYHMGFLDAIDAEVRKAFIAGADWADKHPFSSSREKILAMLDDKYGTDLSMRLKKLDEEYNELREAANRNVPNTLTPEYCVDYTRDILDELSDVNILIFHIAGIMGVSQDELLSMAVDKIKGREKDPNYKRKHPHK